MRTTSILFACAAVATQVAARTPARPMPPVPVQSEAKVAAVDPPRAPAPVRPPRDETLPAPAGRKPFAAEHGRVPAPPVDRLHWSTAADGAQWVLGATYKARFDASGATYVPFLGSDAPCNFPLELSLAAASVDGHAIELAPAARAVRDGDRVVIDRGPVDEVYELGLDSVEQTFVIGERPASGDLRLLVRLASTMQLAETDDGFRFSNEHGGVDVGRAYVREPGGARVPVASRLAEGGLEIVVAREYLATAAFPLVVDPVISTFAIDTISADHLESDVSYDASTDRWLIVYERAFSATDGDVEVQIRNGAGGYAGFAVQYVDGTSQDWRSPQSANLNSANQFLCVAQVTGYPGVPGTTVIGVTIDAITMGQSFPFVISTGALSGDKVVPDVGGDPNPSTGVYCVVWQRNFSATDTDVHAQLVRADRTLVNGTIFVDDSAGSKDSWPSVSKSNGQLGSAAAWTIAWHREIGATDSDVRAARVSHAGTILNASAPIAFSSLREAYPRVASPLADGRVVVAYSLDYGDHDIGYALLSGTTVQAAGSLSGLEQGTTLFRDQIEYSIDSDGQRIVLAYAEQFDASTFDYDVYVSSFAPSGSGLSCIEAHQILEYTVQRALHTDVVAQHSGGATGSRRCLVSWDSFPVGGTHDVYAGLYDIPLTGYAQFCAGDGSVLACPCANEGNSNAGCGNSANLGGASISGAGIADVNAGGFSISVAGVPPNVTCTLFQGTSTAASVFGDGVRCVTGTLIRIRTKTAGPTGAATWPTGAENPIAVTGQVPAGGALRYYQVSYRNSAFFCTPATFNVSNGLSVQWQP